MIYLVIACSSFVSSLLTFFSGFGLGTILMPFFALFFTVPAAIAMTALVHLLHNLFKTGLLWKNVEWKVVQRFGLSAVGAAIPGAYLLNYLAQLPSLITYKMFNVIFVIKPVNMVAGVLLMIFATIGLLAVKGSFFRIKWAILGGILSGFLGGLVGQQGAFRSAYLVQVGLKKEQFIATNSAIAIFVDMARLSIYGLSLEFLFSDANNWSYMGVAIFAAFLGALLGNVLLKKITIDLIHMLVIVILYFLGLALTLGLIS
ncbi:sulfite exporter TauE/SafE family protein [Candidatus Nucleicultrix amoebiphila]|jgi:uncharacterized membrane protein YfcA|uniref:Probable membrane transporter protein n=1 Tax=Candidatus Nucleicultrix amoebiphila FS5 TaxID=1414854 RepID=A0A1W6N3R4_9PROT|nr:sulfite exporter TauE/SafE family protein [Candidatus Nucleicultrix amoebiphila]ARN84483.1 hypothetical protein GQ61_03140 [Candidatus Nucleicultrix amoebiphila FS5]